MSSSHVSVASSASCVYSNWSGTRSDAPRENDLSPRRWRTRTHGDALPGRLAGVRLFLPHWARSIMFISGTAPLPEEERCNETTKENRRYFSLELYGPSSGTLLEPGNIKNVQSCVSSFWHLSVQHSHRRVSHSSRSKFPPLRRVTPSHAMTRWAWWLRSKTQFPVRGNSSEDCFSGTLSSLLNSFSITLINFHMSGT